MANHPKGTSDGQIRWGILGTGFIAGLQTQDLIENGFTVQAGSSIDVKLNSALSYRLAKLEYSHSWTKELNGNNYQNGLQFTTGLILHMGTW